jgi:actin-related protein
LTLPVYQGHPLLDTINESYYSGKEIISHLWKLLSEVGYNFNTAGERVIIQDIKEKLCYVAYDYEKELQKSDKQVEIEYELPDGQFISPSKVRFMAIEPVFTPSLLNYDVNESIQQSIYNSIKQNDFDLCNLLSSNIVLSGASTLFPGFPERVEKELNKFEDNIFLNSKIHTPPDRKNLIWKGANLFANFSNFKDFCLSIEEYNEYGSNVITSKFF